MSNDFNFSFGRSIDTSLKSHNILSTLAYQLNENHYDKLRLR